MPTAARATSHPNPDLTGPLVGASIGAGAALVFGGPLRRRFLGTGIASVLATAGMGALTGALLAGALAAGRRPTLGREVRPPPVGSRALPPGRRLYHDAPPPETAPPPTPATTNLGSNVETRWTDEVVEELAAIDIHEGLINRSRPPMERLGGPDAEAPRSVRGEPVGDLEPEGFVHPRRDPYGRAARVEARRRVEPGFHEPFDAHVGDRGEPGDVHRSAYDLGVELALASQDRPLNPLEVEDLGRERWQESRYALVPYEDVVASVQRGYRVASGAGSA